MRNPNKTKEQLLRELDLLKAKIARLEKPSGRRQAEMQFQKQERLISAIAKTLPAIIYVYDMVMERNVYSNEGIEWILGYSPKEIQAMGSELFIRLIHPEDLDDAIAFQSKILNAGDEKILEIEYRMRHKDRRWLVLRSFERPFKRNSDGSVKQKIGIAIDISEHKKVEKALRESEIRFRLLADHTYDWEYWINPDGNYIYLSPSCELITGYSPEEFNSNPELLFKIVKPDHKEIVHHHYNDENNKESPAFSMEFPIITKGGEECWLEHNCSPVFDDEENYLGRRGNNRDITERKQADEELKKRNIELETFNEVTVGREIKIIDLKKEINELLEKSGGKAKYKIPV